MKTEASGPSDELAALRDSEIRMQRKLTEQRRRESKVVLRAAVCESEKRKLSETVSGLQRAVQPAQKQVPPPPCPSWSPPVGARGGSPVGAWSGETSGHSAFVGAAFTSPGLGNPWDAADAGAPAGPSHPRPAAATGATTGPTLTRPYRSPTLTRLTRPHSPLTHPYRPHPMCDLVDHMGSQCTQPSSLLDSLPARPCTPLALAPPASLPLPPAPTRSHPLPPAPAAHQVRTLMLDPSVNAEIMRLREQVLQPHSPLTITPMYMRLREHGLPVYRSCARM